MLNTVVSFVTYSVLNGEGRHVWYLTPEQISITHKWSLVGQAPVVLSYATSKTSVAILILRFLGRVSFWRRIFLIFVTVIVVIVGILSAVLFFAECTPTRALWEPELKDARCWDLNAFGDFLFFAGCWNIFTDLVLALLPATFIHSLNMPRTKKVALCVLLSLGIL
jgi:hypothetical protein